ncbi:MAG: hypothetical protein ACAI38_09030 [Myxococcota bacterium]|nr:hypothetical protein [Myxococcota bacterium]
MELRQLLAALFVSVLSPATALAFGGAAAEFGHEGQWVPNGKVNFTFESQNDADTTSFLLAPTLLYFITDHWAVGGGFTLGIVSGDGGDITEIGLQPTVAYNLPISDNWSFLPQGSFYFVALGGDADGQTLGLEFYAPFLFHAASHFFLGVGPVLRADVSSDAGEVFRFGATSIVGGYF